MTLPAMSTLARPRPPSVTSSTAAVLITQMRTMSQACATCAALSAGCTPHAAAARILPPAALTERHAEATLATATALNPHIGYDRAADIVKAAAESGRSLREVALEQGVEPAVLEEALDHRRMARPHE